MKESSSNLESSIHMLRQKDRSSNGNTSMVSNAMYENNLKQNGVGTTLMSGTKSVDVLSGSHQIPGIHHNRNHLRPDIIVTSKGCSGGGVSGGGNLVNSHKNSMMMHTSATMMDIKSLQKSNTFTSSLSSGGLKIGSWFDRRARKISMKCSKSITLGKTFRKKN